MARQNKRTPSKLARHAQRLAANVRQLRQDAGLSQRELAAAAGVRQALVSDIERGEANPTFESLVKIADTLRVDLTRIFDGDQ
jgi:transcriptional regulator with XRE-family HTH domain